MSGEWIFVDSSRIHAARYSANDESIYVQFKDGIVYRYKGAYQALWDSFMAADSKGRFISKVLDKLPYERM